MRHPTDKTVRRIIPGKSSKLPAIIVGDELRLKQGLVNLIKNALKFAPKKDIFIQASYCPEKK